MNRSHIEWTEVTWNPTTGCTKVSSGCKNCYAERWAKMQNKRGISQYGNGFSLTLAPNRLNEPRKLKTPSLIFVNSMSDLFHEGVSDSYISMVFETMNDLPNHTFQVLTKRIERAKYLSPHVRWSENIWLGVSVEHNDFIGRIDELRDTSAKIKFISFEPLLGEIGNVNLEGIDWILVGGETGGRARKMEKEWVLSIQRRCFSEDIPFFFKQWGKRAFNPNANDPTAVKIHPHYSKGGCMVENVIYRDYPKK